jgi:hypothetical protein
MATVDENRSRGSDQFQMLAKSTDWSQYEPASPAAVRAQDTVVDPV